MGIPISEIPFPERNGDRNPIFCGEHNMESRIPEPHFPNPISWTPIPISCGERGFLNPTSHGKWDLGNPISHFSLVLWEMGSWWETSIHATKKRLSGYQYRVIQTFFAVGNDSCSGSVCRCHWGLPTFFNVILWKGNWWEFRNTILEITL